MSRARTAVALVLLAATSSACRTAYDFTPVSAAQVRTAMGEMAAPRWSGTLHDDQGRPHEVDGATPLRVRDSGNALPDELGIEAVDERTKELDVASVIRVCVPDHPCPLDDPRTRWQVGTPTQVPDVGLIAKGVFGFALLGGLVAGNVVCFGTDPGSCSNGGRVALGVTDGILGAGAIALVALWAAWRNFRGD